MRSLIAFTVMTAFLMLIALFIFLFHFERKALAYDIEAVGQPPKETIILDATNSPVGYFSGVPGSNLSLRDISREFLDALIAREDSRFFRHHGVDHVGLLRANLRNLREKRVVQGASTITMQLARMTFELRERSYQRKLVEMAIARRIERRYSKQEILRLYVNRIFLGTGMHGIEEAAEGYFGKKPSQLTLPEAAMIAGIIRAPNGFSPFRHPRASRREMQMTIERMRSERMISDQQAEAAKKVQPTVLPQERWMEILRTKQQVYRKNWYLNMIEAELAEIVPGSQGYGGFTIKTTIDHRIQQNAEASIQRWLSGVERVGGYAHPVYPALNKKGEPAYLQGAGVVIDNFNGAIRALVGGRDFSHSEFNRAIHKNRQAGSIIKPLVYATAFETGMFPGTFVNDERIKPGEFRWWEHQDWNPLNSDGVQSGMKPAEVGLIKSRNTMTVRVGETAGIDNVHRMLQHAGMADESVARDPQIFIGNISVSLLSTTSAYTAFPMGGVRHKPYLIESIQDQTGKIIYKNKPGHYQLFSPEAAWMTSSILQKVVEQGGSGAKLRQWGFTFPAGGKTGTTDDFVDAWFVGYTSRLTAGFWVGLDQPAPMLKGAYGGKVAMPVWKDTMAAAAKIGYEFTNFAQPTEIFPVRICRNTGLLASPACESHGCAYTEKIPSSLIPRKFCKRESN
ncbi:MAG: transglycosylase domain-containing protein [Verrucomicrobiales bacterium]|nr:transglycosylase domain-containing protein [Verrucomicrobiales bacterium]